MENDINSKCKKAKEEWWQSKCNEIEQLEALNRHQEMHNKVKEVTGLKSKKTSSECVRDKDDQMLFEHDAIRKRWEEYVSDLYNDNRDENFTYNKGDGEDILQEKVESTLKQLKNNKTPGPATIYSEIAQSLR